VRKIFWLLLLTLFSSESAFSSVCFRATVPTIYESSLLFADFNNDGVIDKYEISGEHSIVSLSQDGQNFSNTKRIHENWAVNDKMFLTDDGIPTDIISMDINNDSYIDIAIAFGSRIVIRKNNSTGEFSAAQQFISLSDLYGREESQISETLAQHDTKLAALDVNHDGYDDLIIVYAEGVSIFLNDTMGNVYHQNNRNFDEFSRKYIDSIYVSDLDMDTFPEVVISANGSYVIFFQGDMDLGIVSIANQSDEIAPVDYDNDGDLDFVEENSYAFCQVRQEPEYYRYWINNGNGAFSEKVVSSAGNIGIEPIIEMPSLEEKPETLNRESGGGSISYLFFLILMIKFFQHRKNIRTRSSHYKISLFHPTRPSGLLRGFFRRSVRDRHRTPPAPIPIA